MELLRNSLVAFGGPVINYASVRYSDNSLRLRGDRVVMGDQYDRVSFLMKLLKEDHYLTARS
jgi:hypothetical protein